MASDGSKSTKQKVMLVMTVIMFLGVIYMIYSMFFAAPDYGTPAPAKATPPAASTPSQAATPVQPAQTMQQNQMGQPNQMMQQGQMGQPNQMMPQGQTGQTNQMMPQGQTGQPNQMMPQGQTGQTNQMMPQGQMGQTNQMVPQGQMGQPNQAMPQGQMGQPNQAMPQGQMGQTNQMMPQGQMGQPNQAMPQNQMSDAYQQQAPAVTVMPAQQLTPDQIDILQQQQEVRDKYLALINQYQMTQMQQKVAQAQAGLYQSQLQAGKTAKEAQDLGIPLDTTGGIGGDDGGGMGAHYSLVFIGRISGAWSAVLLANGQYINIKVGTSLPDGSVVSQISSNRVTIFKDGERRHLMLATVMDKSQDADSGTAKAKGK